MKNFQLTDLYNDGGSVANYSGPNLVMSRFGTGQTGTTPLSGDPQLATTTANNGGPTPTLSLALTSPVDQAGTPVSGITTDQRGGQRSATTPALGSFELQTTTTTVTSNPNVSFNSGKQIAAVTANVSSTLTVNSGTVTFSISGAGENVQANVVNGQATAVFTINAGTAEGQYTITASYSGTVFISSATSGSSNGILTIRSLSSPGATTTTVSDTTTGFSESDQKITLTANVTSGSGTVNEGTVTFLVVQGNTVIGNPVTSGTVNNGQASVSYVVPANTAPSTYTVEAVYNAGPDFIDGSDLSHTLTIDRADTSVQADDGKTGYSTGSQEIDLTATVSSDAGAVNQGTVTFTVMQGSTVIGSSVTSGTVANGQASVVYSLPASVSVGTYTIDAAYNGGTDFLTSSDKTHTLTIVPLASTTTASNAAANPSSSDQNVPLTATVISSLGRVNEGSVTFTILQGKTVIGSPVSSAVSNGQVKANYVLPGGTPSGAYTIEADFSDSLGGINPSSDDTATLTVSAPTAPAITKNPSNQIVTAGSNVTFTASASGNPIPTVQWQVSSDGGKTFTAISGATSTTLTLNNVTTSMSGNEYEAVFTNSLSSATTSAATLTVNAATVPVITGDPASQTVTVGQSVTFTASASGDPTPTVQWEISTDGGKTFSNISGATNTTLTLNNVTTSMNGDEYRAVFTNSAGTATSAAATLTVNAALSAPVITGNPAAGQTVTAGDDVSFTASAGGNPTPTAQWQVSTDGGKTFTDISGATSTTLTLNNVTVSINGNEYRAVFTNSSGSVTSTAAVLAVKTVASKPVIMENPSNQSTTAGANVTFAASASGNPTPTVQWQISTDGGKTFSNISGATSITLTLNNVTTAMNGFEYEAVFTNSVGSATSTAATLTVHAPPSLPPAPPPAPAPSPPPPPPPALNPPPLVAFLDSLVGGGTETVNADGSITVTDSFFGIPLLVSTYDASGNLVSAILLGVNITGWVWIL